MGQNLNDPLPNQTISHNTHSHIEKRFIVTPHPVYTHNPDFKLLHQKITAKKYILRVLTIADTADRNKIEERIFKKIANKNNYLPKLEHYIFQEQKSYCGMTTKCYLFFELGEFTTLREQILKQGIQRAPFSEQELIRGMQNVLFGLLWLRYYKEPHQNINTLNIYYTNGFFVLGDPLICPASNQNPQRYTSPQRQDKIDGQIQSYDPYVSDVFSVALCMLQVVKLGKMDRIYKRNNKVNMEVIIEQVNKIKYPKLKDILQRILIGNGPENRQKFLEMFSKIFNEKLAISQTGSDKSTKMTNKLHTLGGSKRQMTKPVERSNNFLTVNQINNNSSHMQMTKHQANPSIQLQSMQIESKPNIPTLPSKPIIQSISFNTSGPNTHTSFNLPQRNTSASKLPTAFSNYQIPKVSIYTNDTGPIVNPFERKDLHKYHSVQKIIPNNQSLATPIKGYNLNYDSYRKNDLLSLPLSHTKSPLREDYLNKLYENSATLHSAKYNFISNPISTLSSYNPNLTSYTSTSNYLNYNPVLKSDSINISSKFSVDVAKMERPPLMGIAKNTQKLQSEDSSQHLFPKRISPIKKYSDKYLDKYVQNYKLQSYVQIYKNKTHNSTLNRNASHSESKMEQQKEEQTQKHQQVIAQYQEQKTTPLLQNKNEFNSAQNPPSSANSDFSKIIDQNIMNLQHGLSAAIQNSIKSLQTKPITQFKSQQKPKQQYQQHLQEEQSKQNACQLQNMPLMKSQIFSIQGPSVQNSQVKENAESMILGSNQACVESIVKNSISDEEIQKQNIYDYIRPVQEAPKTPIRNYNPNIQLQYNRTIPEEDPAEEESLDQTSPHKPKGQYRELQYQNGGKYCGFIYNNQRNGEGTFYYKDGGYYQGQWKDNAMNGYGRLFYDDGSTAYEGQWHHDQFHGRGKVYNDTAHELLTSFNYQTFQDYELYWKQYDGELSHDLKEGYGKLIFSNNQFYIGKFRNDKPEGEGHFHAKNKIVKGVWAQGKLIKQF